MSSARVFVSSPLAAGLAAILALVALVTADGCGAKSDPLKADLEKFCANPDVATKPPSEWGPAAAAAAKTPELRAVFDQMKSDGGLAMARSRIEELAGKAGLPGCAAVVGWPRQ